MGFDVDPDTLRSAAGKIGQVLSGAEGIEWESAIGGAENYGHDGVFQSIAGFGSTWQLAIQVLRERAASTAEALNSAARTYEQRDDAGAQAMDLRGHGL
jgi:hypothetical protein